MIAMVLPLIVLGVALAQGPHPQGVEKIALDMKVELVSLLGQKLYATPTTGDALKKLEAAFADATKNATAQPGNPAAHVELGRALEALWKYHDAAQAYTKAISLSPADGALFALRGHVFIVLRQFEQAKNDFQHATTLSPQLSDTWKGLGIANYLTQKFDDADKALAEAMRVETDNGGKAYIDRWVEVVDIRLARPQDPTGYRISGILSTLDMILMKYTGGLKKFVSKDKNGALADWHALVDSTPNWTELGVVAAEAEIAAIEGSKKMKAVTF